MFEITVKPQQGNPYPALEAAARRAGEMGEPDRGPTVRVNAPTPAALEGGAQG